MNLDNNRCIHDMLKGQCGICDFKPVATPKKVYSRKDVSLVLGVDPAKSKDVGFEITAHYEGNSMVVDKVEHTPRVKVKLKPRRLNGRSSRRK